MDSSVSPKDEIWFLRVCHHFSNAVYHDLSIVQINPFRPSPSHSATETRSFRFSVKIFGRSALAGAPDKLFHWGLNPISAALDISKYSSKTSDISLMWKCELNTATAASYRSFITFCVETTWRRQALLLLIRRTANLTHELLPIYLLHSTAFATHPLTVECPTPSSSSFQADRHSPTS
jgi:hypothetical protein